MPTAPPTLDPPTAPRAGIGARLGRMERWAFWPVALALAAACGWKVWDDRPLPELATVPALVEGGRTAEAERVLRDWLRRVPDYAEARLMLARLLAGRDDLPGCAAQLHAVPFWSPLKAEALFREGQTWEQAGRARDAEAAYRAYLANDPNRPQPKPYRDLAEVELINLLTLEDRWPETRDLIWKAYPRALGPQRDELRIMSLRTVLERSSPRAAVASLRRFVEADPGDFEARLALAAAADAAGFPAESDAAIAACLEARPEEPRVWQTRLAVLKRRGDLEALRKALAVAPAAVEPVLSPYRGEVFAHDGKWPEAYAAFAKAVAAEPNDSVVQYRFAQAAQQVGRKDESDAAFRRHARLTAARSKLPDALKAFSDEGRAAGTPPEKRAALAKTLAAICRDLGLDRDADEWAKAAAEPVVAAPTG